MSLTYEEMQQIVDEAPWSHPGSYNDVWGHHLKVGTPEGGVRAFQNAENGYLEVTDRKGA